MYWKILKKLKDTYAELYIQIPIFKIKKNQNSEFRKRTPCLDFESTKKFQKRQRCIQIARFFYIVNFKMAMLWICILANNTETRKAVRLSNDSQCSKTIYLKISYIQLKKEIKLNTRA